MGNLLPRDKALHLVTGFVGGLVLGLVYGPTWAQRLTTSAGVLKEAMDAWENFWARRAGAAEPHTVEVMDAVATSWGGWCGSMVAHLIRGGRP